MSGAPPIWLILSGAYVEQELIAEFGPLPPAFLPVGTRRLYELQLAALPDGAAVYLTLPEGYQPPPGDVAKLAELGVVLIGTPEGLNLGQAVMWALNYIGAGQAPVHILHGDTLLDGLSPAATDVVAAAHPADGYSWAELEVAGMQVLSLGTTRGDWTSERKRLVACGYFALSNALSLIRAIARSGGDFVGGLNRYCQEQTLQTLPVSEWLDFGHVQTYFRSRRTVTTARSFNSLRIDEMKARKSSSDADKIDAEAAWFRNVPTEIQPYSARLLAAGRDEADEAFYETEYKYVPSLSELFVHGANGRAAWAAIMASCERFLHLCARHRGPGGAGSGDAVLTELAGAKTIARLERFAAETGFDLHAPTRLNGRPMPSLARLADEVGRLVDTRSGRAECVMHGDFCFSNILFNGRMRRIRVLDPRGFVHARRPTIYGDSRYDLAKLAHSVLGRYEQLVAGRCRVTQDGTTFELDLESAPHHRWLEASLDDLVVNGARASGLEVRAITMGLFLSMLPLHTDRPDRQRAFIANALRLYAELESVPA